MCGRFTLTLPSYEELARLLGVEVDPEDALSYRPRFNVAPMDPHWVARAGEPTGPLRLVRAVWGLVPARATSAEGAARRINARSETVHEKPSFRAAFEARRCVVPVDGFYEWTGPPRARRPIWFHSPEGDLLRLAGLWEPARRGEAAPTFTVLTTAANDVVAPVHDRMPVVLSREDAATYVRAAHGADIRHLLRPAPVARLVGRAVSPRANRVEHDDPACLDPYEPPPEPAPEPRKGETLSLFGDAGEVPRRRRGSR